MWDLIHDLNRAVKNGALGYATKHGVYQQHRVQVIVGWKELKPRAAPFLMGSHSTELAHGRCSIIIRLVSCVNHNGGFALDRPVAATGAPKFGIAV